MLGNVSGHDVVELLVSKRHVACVAYDQPRVRQIDIYARSLCVIVREKFQQHIGATVRRMPAANIKDSPCLVNVD
jgi:hypothetical protein